jgi:hypothetical protein
MEMTGLHSLRSTLQIFKRAASLAEAVIGFRDGYDRRRLPLSVQEFFHPNKTQESNYVRFADQ